MNSYKSKMKTAPSTPDKLDKIVFQSMFSTLKNNHGGCWPSRQKYPSPMEILTLRPLLHRRGAGLFIVTDCRINRKSPAARSAHHKGAGTLIWVSAGG